MTNLHSLKIIKSQGGVALLMTLFAVIMMTVIAVEVQYGTQVESIAANQSLQRLKAYYAAKAGVELSLYRIMLYKKAQAQFGKTLGPQASLLDKIWQMPFAWPPVVPGEIGSAVKDQLNKVIKESSFDGKYITTIESEEAKIDINDLGSPAKTIVEATKAKLLNIYTQRLKVDDSWAEKYQSYNFEKLINNIIDWIDEDNTSLNGGEESSAYSQIKETDKLPPNQPFKSLQEVHMVADMEDDLFDVIAGQITVYGSKAININYASKEVLMSLDPNMEKEMAEKVIERRNDQQKGGPFRDAEDFYSFLESVGLRTNTLKEKNFPFIFDRVLNFRITSIGNSSNVARKIVAVAYDFDQVKDQLKDQLSKEKQSSNPTPPDPSGKTPDDKKKTDEKKPDGSTAQTQQAARPTVVYWFEN